MTRIQNKTTKGFSLLELLLVVAVGAILILAGLAIYRNITNSTQTNEAVRLLNVIKQEVMRAFEGQTSYGPFASLEDMLINMDAIPASNIQGNAIVSPFTLGLNSVNVISNTNTFQIQFNDVPQEACIRLFTAYTADDKDLFQFRVGGTTIYDRTAGTNNITPMQANTSCTSTTTSNDMHWVFR